MIRKLYSTLTILLISLFVTNPVRSVEPYYADAFDVQILLREGGSAIITETIEFQFSGNLSTFVSREISAANTDGIAFLDASMDGSLLSQGTQAGQVEVEAGIPLKVTWHFLLTSHASHIFVVRYRVEGIIRKGNADTLIWRVLPEDHDYSVVHSTIILDYPSEPPLIEQPASGRKLDVLWENDLIILTAGEFAKDEDLLLTARFAPNSLIQVAPHWQIQKEETDAAAARTLSVGFIVGIATLIVCGLRRMKRSRVSSRDKFDESQWTREFIN